MIRDLLKRYPRVAAAGIGGLLVFLTLFGPVFMRDVRPEPLSRDEVQQRALDFAALEGWTAAGRFARTIPIEGDDAAAVREASGAVPDRETLPDPAWETWIITNPRSVLSAISTAIPPDPLLSVNVTPAGDVVQYIELSSSVAGQPVGTWNSQRMIPLREIAYVGLFETAAEDRVAPTEEERANALDVAHTFFTRHRIDRDGQPVSMVFREGKNRSRIAYLTWDAPGAGGTTDRVRVIVAADHVAAYDRDLRNPAAAPAEPGSDPVGVIVAILLPLLFLIAGPMIAVLIVIRRRQGEIDMRSAAMVFVAYVGLTALEFAANVSIVGATLVVLAGHIQVWFGFLNFAISVPFITGLFALVIAGAWAVGEGQAYVVWPRRLIRPLSAIVRGRFRTRELAEPVAIGYLFAFQALGAATLFGLLAPASPTPSVASLQALNAWPVALSIPLQGFQTAILTIAVSGMFVMTYVRARTRRLWIAITLGTIASLACRPVSTLQTFFPRSPLAAFAVAAALTVGACIVFARHGPLASFTAIFAYCTFVMAYPLVLTGNRGHAASGAWAMLLGMAPAAIAAYGAWRPSEQSAGAIPAHVRRAIDRLRIAEEFDVARQVQARLLPTASPKVSGLDVVGTCAPANEVGGDYFDYFELAGDRLAIAVGDVSGKGVGAAIYMTLTKSYMVTQTVRAHEPVRVLSRVNEHLRRNLARGTFVTMLYAVLDAGAGRLTYARAGHNPPLLIRATGEGDFLNAPGIALGAAGTSMFEATTHVETAELRIGDLLLLYTDGVTEAMNHRGDEYGEDRLIARTVALARSTATAAQAVDAILKDVRSFAGRAAQHDDITIVAIRVVDSRQ